MRAPCVSYNQHRFPCELIMHAVWLYRRFPLSFCLVEEMLLEQGTVVSYETTIRRRTLKFGAAYVPLPATQEGPAWRSLASGRGAIVIRSFGHRLWWSVDQDGYVFDEILQTGRNTKAAKHLLVRILERQGLQPMRMIADKLKSYEQPDAKCGSRYGISRIWV